MLARAGVDAAEVRSQEASKTSPVQQQDWGGAAQAWGCWTEHCVGLEGLVGFPLPPRKLEVSLVVSGKDYKPGWARDITNVTTDTPETLQMSPEIRRNLRKCNRFRGGSFEPEILMFTWGRVG